jgi:hypothetical protein
MPYPFALATTSFVSFSTFFSSSTHPSLPLQATNARTVLRDALKNHKRLPAAAQATSLATVQSALDAYVPYLFSIDAGLSGKPVAGEEVDVVLLKELEVEWRCTLSARSLGGVSDPPRAKLRSLEPEMFFVLETLAYTYSLQAREQLRPLYRNDAAPLEKDQRTAAITSAMKLLLQANAIHGFLLARSSSTCHGPVTGAVDISPAVLGALASLAMAEATLITVLKDDPYPSAVAEDRNKNSKDWMFRAPELSSGRTNLFGRLCIAAAEHAGTAAATLRNAKGVDEDLIGYVDDLRRTARAKAARFQAIGAESQGKTGEGIAWLRGGKKELGFETNDEGKVNKLTKLRKDFQEKREDKKVQKGSADWGADGGKFEEGRVLDMLEKKWVKENDTVRPQNVEHSLKLFGLTTTQLAMQIIPPFESLLSNMPSGREYHQRQDYQKPMLEEDALARMRAPPDPVDSSRYRDPTQDSDSEDEDEDPVGAFPGTRNDYTPSSSSTYY